MNLIPESIAAAEDDAIWLLRELIRIDTTNAGHTGDTVGEAVAAEFVESVLREVGCGGAAIIGAALEAGASRVILESSVGGERVLDMLSGEQLPRIC